MTVYLQQSVSYLGILLHTCVFFLNTQVCNELPMYPVWFPFKPTKTPKMEEKTLNKWHKMKDKREMNYLQLAKVVLVHRIDRMRRLKIKGKTCTSQGKSQNELFFN